MNSSTLSQVELVRSALNGGATVIQLREKKASNDVILEVARELKTLTDEFDIPLIINDRVDTAIAVDADGVHVGDEDMPVIKIRRLLGDKKIIGASCTDLKTALLAEEAGADYIGLGPIYQTDTKKCGVAPLGPAALYEIKKKIRIPIVAIGGINESNLREVLLAGADGVAIISAIAGAPDINEAIARIKKLIKETKGVKEKWV